MAALSLSVTPAVRSTSRGKLRRLDAPASAAAAAASGLCLEVAPNAPSARSVSRGHGLIRAARPSTPSVSRTRRHQGEASYSKRMSSGVGAGVDRRAGSPFHSLTAPAARELSRCTNMFTVGSTPVISAPLSARRRPAAVRLVPTSTGCSRGAEACGFGHVSRAARCLLACERWQETPRSWLVFDVCGRGRAGGPAGLGEAPSGSSSSPPARSQHGSSLDGSLPSMLSALCTASTRCLGRPTGLERAVSGEMAR